MNLLGCWNVNIIGWEGVDKAGDCSLYVAVCVVAVFNKAAFGGE